MCKIKFASGILKSWDVLEASDAARKSNSFSKKLPFVFDENRLLDSILMPTYRRKTNDIEQIDRYYVAEISKTMTAHSEFPGDRYSTYTDYFEQKYSEKTTIDQPLLDVDHTPNRLNMIVPRKMKRNTEIVRKVNEHGNKQYFIGEICRVHPCPNFYWRKLVNIPAMTYRLTTLLNANELRESIAEKTGVGLKLNISLSKTVLQLDRFQQQETGIAAVRDPFECGDIPEASEFDVIDEQVEFEDFHEDTEQSLPIKDQTIQETYDYNAIEKFAENAMTSDEMIIDPRFISLDFDNLNSFKVDFNIDQRSIGPTADKLIKALTLTSSSDGFNLDRIEMLGDSFLKLSYSTYLYCSYPYANEGHLSALRSFQVANRNLYEIGRFRGFAEYIRILCGSDLFSKSAFLRRLFFTIVMDLITINLSTS